MRALLHAKLNEIRSLLADLTAPPDAAGSMAYRNRNDRSGLAGQRHSQAAAVHNLTRQIVDIERAIEKLDQGTHHVCDGCGNSIPAARLENRPWVVRCVACVDR